MRTYIQQPGQVGVQGGTIGNAGYLAQTGPQLPPMARLGPMDNTNQNMGQINDAYLQEQERQRLLQEQQAQAELNNSMYGGGQYGQADQYSAASAGFQNKFVS